MSHKGCKHLTEGQRVQIRELHRTGRTTQDIAARVKCTVYQVRHALKCAGMKPGGGRGGICYAHADRLREWARQGLSLSEMARRIGSSHSKIRSFFRRHGIEYIPFRQNGANNPAWKGGRMLDTDGYILVHQPDHPDADRHGYVREHRLVMESILGRPLGPNEVVHHKDDDPRNNDPENLELFESNAAHLAETLKGRCPNWSEEGLRKIQERNRRFVEWRRETNRSASVRDDLPSPGMNDPTAS